jgi:hypothetical protein
MSNKCGRIINNELDEMWEKDVVANSKALSTHLLVQIKEPHPPPPKKKEIGRIRPSAQTGSQYFPNKNMIHNLI